MNDCKGNVRDVQIAYIGGGSRGMGVDFHDGSGAGAVHERMHSSVRH